MVYNRTFRRSIRNTAELINHIRLFYPTVQYVMFDGLSFREQALVMTDVDVFIGVHGAQMSNIMFMKPFSGVIEVFNPLFFLPCYQSIAQYSRLQYVAVRNTTIINDKYKGSSWAAYVNVDVLVNTTSMVTILHQMVQNLHSYV